MSPDFILEIPGAFSPEICRQMIERFEADPRVERACVGPRYEYRPETRTGEVLQISRFPEWRDLDQVFVKSISECLNAYRKEFDALNTINLADEGYMLAKQREGDKFDWHIDVDSRRFADRQFCAFWYLSDVEEGGQTEFWYQNRSIKPEQGKLAFFPAFWTHKHRGAPVIRGVKYTARAWLHIR
jgi:hypothetical protein